MNQVMRIGERGQVVIPKEIRERFGLLPNTEVEFVEDKGRLLIRRATSTRKAKHDKWNDARGLLKGKVKDVDRDIEEMRGR
jgi:AbrB family looped-hinge helix DNA binding protein